MINSSLHSILDEGIVDAHVHYWDPFHLHYDWLERLPDLDKVFMPCDYAKASASARVTKILFVECGCDPETAADEVDWVASLAIQEPRISGVVAHASLEKGSDARKYLELLSRKPLVRGVRRVFQWEPEDDFCLKPGFIEGVSLLEDFGFTLDLCIRHEQLKSATELISKFPGVHFILDHFGKPDVKNHIIEPWRSEIQALATLPNVSCKISGLTTEADWEKWTPDDLRPYFDTILDFFGPDRLIFGGDWPVCALATEYKIWVSTVAELVSRFNPEDYTKLFRTNAERVYRI